MIRSIFVRITNVNESRLNIATVCKDLIFVFYSANSWLGESVFTVNLCLIHDIFQRMRYYY